MGSGSRVRVIRAVLLVAMGVARRYGASFGNVGHDESLIELRSFGNPL